MTEPSVPAAHCVLHQAMAQTLRHGAHDGVGRETHPIDPWDVECPADARTENDARNRRVTRGNRLLIYVLKFAIYKISRQS